MQQFHLKIRPRRNELKTQCNQPEYLTFKEPKNRFQGTNSATLCILAGQYDNPIPTQFLAPIDCLKIPSQKKTALATALRSIKMYTCIVHLSC
jgi:hypothetical protein